MTDRSMEAEKRYDEAIRQSKHAVQKAYDLHEIAKSALSTLHKAGNGKAFELQTHER